MSLMQLKFAQKNCELQEFSQLSLIFRRVAEEMFLDLSV